MGIRGNYHSVSSKWLQGYLNEYVWRYTAAQSRSGSSASRILRAAS